MSIYNKNRLSFDNYDMLVDAKEFLRLTKRQDNSKLLKIQFIMPKLGSRSFGKFLLTYKYEPTKAKPAGQFAKVK